MVEQYIEIKTSNPRKYIKTIAELQVFINKSCTIEDLQCFLNVLVQFEEYEYACIVRDKIKTLNA